MAMLCLNFNQISLAQQTPLKPIRVGEKLPAWFWKQEHEVFRNNKIEKETLEKYKDKLLILDFWATWCGSCIKKFPLSDSLQQVYSKRLNIILVNTKSTKDNQEGIAKILQGYNYRLPSVLNDTTLTQIFPHRIIPQYVWIESGELRSITGSELMTEQSILSNIQRRDMLNEKIKKLRIKAGLK